ncbi:hypothetical protein EB061_13255 [bacterium]|nr:hypothetical protein [bacterium]
MKAAEIIKKYQLSEVSREAVSKLKTDQLEQVRVLRIIDAFSECAACGGRIEFATRTDWIHRQVTETGACSGCSGKITPRVYPLC